MILIKVPVKGSWFVLLNLASNISITQVFKLDGKAFKTGSSAQKTGKCELKNIGL
jgi:hypothetical protein